MAELARTDRHRFRALVPDSDETKALKALTQRSYREDLVEERVALANRLRAELEAFWPGAAALETEARREVVLSLVATLRPASLVERIKLLSSRIAQAVRAHPDGEIFLSLFRDPGSTLTAARLVA